VKTDLTLQNERLQRSNEKLMRSRERARRIAMDSAEKNVQRQQEIKRLQNVLLDLYRLDEPTAELVRRRIRRAIPREVDKREALRAEAGS
jgi:hypothetical protein